MQHPPHKGRWGSPAGGGAKAFCSGLSGGCFAPARLPSPAPGCSPPFLPPLPAHPARLHYYDDVMCQQQRCRPPGKGSAYYQDLEQLAAFRGRHRRRLPAMVWMDTPPQHFPGTGDWAGRLGGRWEGDGHVRQRWGSGPTG